MEGREFIDYGLARRQVAVGAGRRIAGIRYVRHHGLGQRIHFLHRTFLFGLLHGFLDDGHEMSGKEADDGNDDQKLDQREAFPFHFGSS
jgi:hypothetical protein